MSDVHALKRAIDDDNRLRVHLVPMVFGDNPWRTREDYKREQERDTHRFWLTIGTLIVSLIGSAAAAIIAIVTILSLRP
jgi:hypothetical protein